MSQKFVISYKGNKSQHIEGVEDNEETNESF
jgi:hypothetical protein